LTPLAWQAATSSLAPGLSLTFFSYTTFSVVNALIRANKRFDMLILPGQRHGFGDMDEYFYWRMVDFFSEHLKGKKESSVDIPQR
jgi:hypothetical protein